MLQNLTVQNINIDLVGLLTFVFSAVTTPYITAFLVARSWQGYVKGLVCVVVSFVYSFALILASGNLDTTNLLALGMLILVGSHVWYMVFAKEQALRLQDAFGITDKLMEKLQEFIAGSKDNGN